MNTIRPFCVLLLAVVLLPVWAAQAGEQFNGLDNPDLPEVTLEEDNWGLQIVFFDVGQADAILLLTPDGDACLIDSGSDQKTDKYGRRAAKRIADFLRSTPDITGLDSPVDRLTLVYTTHYDADHIAGLDNLVKDHDITIGKAYDQGASYRRHGKRMYGHYVTAVGDANNNLIDDDSGDHDFVRRRMEQGQEEKLGEDVGVTIRCVAVRGDNEGGDWDLGDYYDPSVRRGGKLNENPGSIALVIRLGEFELYTAGDQTQFDSSGDPEPRAAFEEPVLASGAIPDGNDVDVIKVSHHGSATSTSPELVRGLSPEVAVISTMRHARGEDRFPRRIALLRLQERRCYVLITGNGASRRGRYTNKPRVKGEVSEEAVFNKQGDVRILVSADGETYTVRGMGDILNPDADSGDTRFNKTFSAVDADNKRNED